LLLGLAGSEPPHLPEPDLRGAPVELARALEPEVALDIDCRVLLDAERPGEAGPPDVAAALGQDPLADAPGSVPVDAELDRRLRKRAAEEGRRGRRPPRRAAAAAQ